MKTKIVYNFNTLKENIKDTVGSAIANNEIAVVIDVKNNNISVVEKSETGEVTIHEDIVSGSGSLGGSLEGINLEELLTKEMLTPLDLSDFPTTTQLEEFNRNITEELVKVSELTELDLTDIPTSTQIEEFNRTINDGYAKLSELTEVELATREEIEEFNRNLTVEIAKVSELTEFDLPTQEQIDQFNAYIEAELIAKSDLDILDLSLFPTADQIQEFNENIKGNFIAKSDLDVLDLSDFPTNDELKAFNETVKLENYVKQNDLTAVDLNDFIFREEYDKLVNKYDSLLASLGAGTSDVSLPELTNERVVATINGKIVYEKTVIGNLTSTADYGSEVIANVADLNIDLLLSSSHTSRRNDGISTAGTIDLNNHYYTSSNYESLYFNNKTNSFTLYWYIRRQPGPVYITIRYTKKEEVGE